MVIIAISATRIVRRVRGAMRLAVRGVKVGITWTSKTPAAPVCQHVPINNTVTTGKIPTTQFASGAMITAPLAMTYTSALVTHAKTTYYMTTTGGSKETLANCAIQTARSVMDMVTRTAKSANKAITLILCTIQMLV